MLTYQVNVTIFIKNLYIPLSMGAGEIRKSYNIMGGKRYMQSRMQKPRKHRQKGSS